MTVVGEAIVLVRPLTAGFSEKVLADTDKAMVGAGRKAGASFAQSLASIIPGANAAQKGIVAIGAAAGAAAIASVHMANEFNQKLLLIHTQAGASSAELERMRAATLNLAPSVGTGPAQLAEALYHIESTGFRGAEALDQLKIAAQGAKIGQADLDDTTYALTSTLMTGIGGINGAKDAMAALDAIVGTGDMHMQDLNGAISTGFLATAETFGVSLQSVGAALAYMTDRGSGAQESATRLRMSMALLAAPADRASKMISALGLGGAEVTARTGAMTSALQAAHLTTTQLADDMRKPDGIQVALQDLVTHLDQSGLSADASAALISRAFGGGRSGAAIMSLVQHLDTLKGKFEDQVRIAGEYDERWKATTESTSFRWQQFTTLVQTDVIRMGERLIPFANTLGSTLFAGLEAAPRVLAPLGAALGDVGHEIGNIAHEAEPLGRILILALGGTVYVAVRATAFLLRDIVAPALHLVADGLHFLTGTTPGIILLSAVIAARLIPALINAGRQFAAWALEKLVVGFVNVTTAAEGLGSALMTMNPVLVAVAVAVGVAIGWYIRWKQAKDEARRATDELVESMKAEAAGHDNSIFAAIGKQLNDLNIDDNIRRLGVSVRDVELAVNGNSDAAGRLNRQFRALTDGSKVSGRQLLSNRVDVLALAEGMGKLSGRVDNAVDAYGAMQHNQAIVSGTMRAAKAPVDALTLAHQDAAAATKLLDNANKQINSSVFESTKALQKQVNLLQDYSSQAKITGKDIQDTITANIRMLAAEGANINRLSAQHVDPGFIAALKDQGPQYVAAAAGLGDQALAALNASWLAGQTQLEHTGAAIGRALAPAAAEAGAEALAAKQDAMRRAAQITFFSTVQGAMMNAVSIAGAHGGNAGGRFGDGLTRSKDAVLTAALNALPGPVRAATLRALGIATDAGGQLPHNLAAAINANTPAAAQAAEGMRLAVQARVDMLHGKTVEVRADDLASGALSTINGNIQTLEGLNNTLKAMRYNADGNVYEAHDAQIAPGGAMRVWAEPETGGEAYIPLSPAKRGRSISIWAETGRQLGMFADGGVVGGPVDAGVGMNTWPVLMGRYAQSLAAGTDPSKLTGGGGITGNVLSWLPIVLLALQLNGAPLSYASKVLAQIQFESGGDPNIHQNVIDINTFNGSGGAQGLMQVLLGTFLANHVPGTSMNIFDPLANVAAGIHHAIHEDPGGLDYLGQGHGYDTGGPIPPGRTLVINNTGADEAWVLNEQGMAARRDKAPVHLEQTNYYNGVDLDEAVTDAGRRMMHVVTSAMR